MAYQVLLAIPSGLRKRASCVAFNRDREAAVERVDRTTSPLVVGRFYLVPTVYGLWCETLDNWPVIGHKHNDVEFFSFTLDHYHVDQRFLDQESEFVRLGYAFRRPLHDIRPFARFPEGVSLGPVVYRKRKCRAASSEYTQGYQPQVVKLRHHFSGRQCARGKGGWICPHRKASLGSIAPIAGYIQCPLHGLFINAETGIVATPSSP